MSTNLKKLSGPEITAMHYAAELAYAEKIASFGRASVGTIMADNDATALRIQCNETYAELKRRGLR